MEEQVSSPGVPGSYHCLWVRNCQKDTIYISKTSMPNSVVLINISHSLPFTLFAEIQEARRQLKESLHVFTDPPYDSRSFRQETGMIKRWNIQATNVILDGQKLNLTFLDVREDIFQ
jgi:hypothetical protein